MTSVIDLFRRVGQLEQDNALLREQVESLHEALREPTLFNVGDLAGRLNTTLRQMDRDTRTLKLDVRNNAFETFTCIVQRKMKEVSSDIAHLWDRASPQDFDATRGTIASTLQQDIQGPSAMDRIPALTKLRRLHDGRCPKCLLCKQNPVGEGPLSTPPCPMKPVVLLCRDLVVLSMLLEHQQLTRRGLSEVYDNVAEGGTRWHVLTEMDRAHLSQAFAKIRILGKVTSEEFCDQVRVPAMFGPDINDEDLEQVHLLYTECSAAHSYFIGHNKARGKVRKARGRSRPGGPSDDDVHDAEASLTLSSSPRATASSWRQLPLATSMTRVSRAVSRDDPMRIELSEVDD